MMCTRWEPSYYCDLSSLSSHTTTDSHESASVGVIQVTHS
jgi:hypothetical protein